MYFGKSHWRTFEEGLRKEWLITNGLGGFGCGTIIGANARRYHGLLIAALNPPVERHLILSQISESIEVEGQTFYLHAFKTQDFVAHGEYYLEAFVYDVLPSWHYRVGDIFIEKTVAMVYGKNKVVILYRVRNGGKRSVLNLTPLVNFRNFHYTSSKPYMQFSVDSDGRKMGIIPYRLNRKIELACSEGKLFLEDKCYFYNIKYDYEAERGLDFIEDHYIPGFYKINLEPYAEREITVIASLDDNINNLNGAELIDIERNRQKKLVARNWKQDEFYESLVYAADKFIVKRTSTNSKTIIAGYPWFGDWGRDTMIALPGLTLITERYKDAREILYTFSQYIKEGLLPNVFPDDNGEPAYNTVDASLWFFQAVYKYFEYTNDTEFIEENLYFAMKKIIEKYKKGTFFDIKMDSDYLIAAGNQETQLTWMDAKVGDWVVTPRHGKAVEINALWYNALMVMANFSKKAGKEASKYLSLASKVKENFIKVFWNENKNCLFDVVGAESKDDKVRPNQIMACSLSFPILEGEKAKAVVDVVFKKLYTALGLKTLSGEHEQYRGRYIGDQYARDGAYHQGTVWAWFLGQFITAWVRVYGQEKKNIICKFFAPFKDHLKDACIGNISEIFDGDEPLIPRGCFAQAWSVAEILRAYYEEYLRLCPHTKL